ncbi:phosphoglycerate dehydrogenase [Enterococcus innesii]|uniref:phosphoglycerate dehydrogenase n=1 Tax=Enterococcus innesii TaxID=2839759 RepID=UPI003B5AFC0B
MVFFSFFATLKLKGGLAMKKIILATREFRDTYVKQIEKDYQFLVYTKDQAIDWSQVEITIGWKPEWKDYLLTEKTNLKWVQAISAGVDTLPLKEFANYGIRLSNGSGIHAESITDHLLALLFMENRGIFQAIQQQRKQQWSPNTIPYTKLSDQEILIVGTGQIGQKLAQALTFFGVSPIGINTSGHDATGFEKTFALSDLHACAKTADCVINILPLTEETTHLYDAAFFAQMKPSASFYNVGRGPSVDTTALAKALEKKQLAFAALDVFEEEPLPENDPLWLIENLLITPHISGHTPHFQKAFMAIFLANLQQFLANQELVKNEINLDKGY